MTHSTNFKVWWRAFVMRIPPLVTYYPLYAIDNNSSTSHIIDKVNFQNTAVFLTNDCVVDMIEHHPIANAVNLKWVFLINISPLLVISSLTTALSISVSWSSCSSKLKGKVKGFTVSARPFFQFQFQFQFRTFAFVYVRNWLDFVFN